MPIYSEAAWNKTLKEPSLDGNSKAAKKLYLIYLAAIL